jgi:hypothetical protein
VRCPPPARREQNRMTEQWESRCPNARAPRSAGRRRSPHLCCHLHYCICAASFPDHHLSKSDLHGAHETQTPHLALGAGGALSSLPDRETARRTLRSAPPCIQPCTESS